VTKIERFKYEYCLDHDIKSNLGDKMTKGLIPIVIATTGLTAAAALAEEAPVRFPHPTQYDFPASSQMEPCMVDENGKLSSLRGGWYCRAFPSEDGSERLGLLREKSGESDAWIFYGGRFVKEDSVALDGLIVSPRVSPDTLGQTPYGCFWGMPDSTTYEQLAEALVKRAAGEKVSDNQLVVFGMASEQFQTVLERILQYRKNSLLDRVDDFEIMEGW
jgi:hypothetical protein